LLYTSYQNFNLANSHNHKITNEKFIFRGKLDTLYFTYFARRYLTAD